MLRIDLTHKYVFCPPPLGKPDPKEPRPLVGVDTRNRVIQSGLKGNTSWDSVFNILRDRFKAPNTSHLSARTFEQIASARRKASTTHDRSLPDITDQLHQDVIQKVYRTLTKTNVKKISPLLEHWDRQDPKLEVPVSSVLPQFQNQDKYQNLYDFLVHLKFDLKIDIEEKFFESLGINPKYIFEDIKNRDPAIGFTYGFEWNRIPPSQKVSLLNHLARLVCIQKYELEVSSWTPKQSIEKLIAEIERRGPLAIGGRFGIPLYMNPPKKLERQIEGRDLYGWPKDAPKHSPFDRGSMILVVGAEKTSQRQLVYYIDPTDPSDPNDPSKQRIFVTNYSNLISEEQICDLHGFLRTNASSSIGYAVYRKEKEKPKLAVPLFNLQKSYLTDQPNRLRQEMKRQEVSASPEFRFSLLET